MNHRNDPNEANRSKMDIGGAYGGGKAGGAFDPIAFVQRPTVILRAVCWVSILAGEQWNCIPFPTKKDTLLKKYLQCVLVCACVY